MTLKNNLRTLRHYALFACLIPALSGCFGVAAVGIGTTALMASDRRASETYVTDEGIELRASNRIRENYGSNTHVNATSYNRMLLLTGEVPNAETKANIEKLLSSVPNLKAISNELAIANASSFGSRSNDTYITSKVKARFVDAKQFSAHHVKVVTEAGVVFLLGLVTQTEADAASDIARTTGGVIKVVRVFEIITPEAARAIDGQPRSAHTQNPASPQP
ncbi:MAG: BON domain-containing protein [Rugosibacter sp.]|jgi:osmotically-inducible protein OsmY